MATNYQKFLTILVKWPVNAQKKPRDYAFHLRSLLKQQNPDEDFFPGKSVDIQKKLNSLIRLGENTYGRKYPHTNKTGASGLKQEDVALVLTDEFINYFNNSHTFSKNIFN